MKIENYIKNAEKIYYDKKIKQSEYAKTIILKSRNKTFTLENINNYNEKVKPALMENEINSIYRALDKKIAIFKTTTLNPNYNLSNEQSNQKEIDKQLQIQYEQLKNYHQFKNQFKADGKRLKNQGVRIYDLTEALNLHTHSIDILKSKENLEHYIKSVIYAKKKFDMGRIELCITKYTLKHIKNLFKDFKIRVKNRYMTLNLRCEKGAYIIEEKGKIEEGNYIYFKLLDNKKNSKKNMSRYFYKNILKERYTKTPTEEHTIFSKLGIRIKQFSNDFFNRKVQKHILYRTNNKLFFMIKRSNEDIHLSPTPKDLKSFLFYTASLFRKSILFLFDNKKFVFYSKNTNPSTKWVQIVDLKTYEKEAYEECLNNNDIQITKIKDKTLLFFYQELEVRNIFIKSKFVEEFEKKKFFDKDKISQVWKEYLMMLYYERSKINIHKYFEELICDYYDEPSYEIAIYRHF